MGIHLVCEEVRLEGTLSPGQEGDVGELQGAMEIKGSGRMAHREHVGGVGYKDAFHSWCVH